MTPEEAQRRRLHADELQRTYTLVRGLLVITAAVVVAGAVVGKLAPITGRADADGSFTVAFLGGAAFLFLRRGYRCELRAGARSGSEAVALAVDQVMWILLGLSLGPIATIAAVVSYPDLKLVALCAVLGIVLLAKGLRSAWNARRYVTGSA